MKRFIAVLLVVGLVCVSVPFGTLGQQLTNSVVKIKTDVARRLRTEKANVTVRLRNGSELKGRITQAAENMFTLKEKNGGAHRDIAYEDVSRVKGNGLSKGAKFGILTALVSGAVIIGALISLKNFDPFKDGVLR